MSRWLYCGDCPDCWLDRCENVSIARCGNDKLPRPKMLGIFRLRANEAEVEVVPPEWCPAGIYGKSKPPETPTPEESKLSPFERADAVFRKIVPGWKPTDYRDWEPEPPQLARTEAALRAL